MDEWIFWILTCGFSLYFVVLLLEFNRPSQKLMEQIDNQEVRRQDMQRRLSHAQEQTEEMKGRLAKLEHDMDDLEAKRKDILPEANKRLMVHIPAGPFTVGGRYEDSPRSERPAHTIYSRPTT
ncbi:MAG: hypothetical protein CME20_14960 [Gemmatimonadetes bacterium]|nr:hypothetical protein [Gemmatimonadota bacterium]